MATALHICRRYVLNEEEVSKTFDMLDIDKDGRLSRVELAILLRTIKIEPSSRDLDFIVNEMDREKSGLIEKSAFLNYLRCPPINKLTIGELHEQFRRFEENGDGMFSKGALKRVLNETADLYDEEAIEEFFDAADSDHDGRISFDDFIRLIRED